MTFRKRSVRLVSMLLWAGLVWGQTASPSAPAEADSEKVVVRIDGVDYTAADIQRARASLPGQFQQTASRFSNREFIEQYRRFLAMAKKAEEEEFHKKEPYRTQLEHYRMLYLAQAYTTELSRNIVVPSQENLEYYEKHKDEYQEVRVAAIYIDYSTESAAAKARGEREKLTEDQARAKAARLVEELRNGAEFAALAEEHSDDRDSAEKGGDLGFFNPGASLPAAIKQTIFDLDPGEISDPVQDGGRFYIFQVTERRPRPFHEVEQDIARKLRGMKLIERLKEITETLDVEYKDEAFLNQRPGQNPPPASGGEPGIEVIPKNLNTP